MGANVRIEFISRYEAEGRDLFPGNGDLFCVEELQGTKVGGERLSEQMDDVLMLTTGGLESLGSDDVEPIS
jgi:hypothetical protein